MQTVWHKSAKENKTYSQVCNSLGINLPEDWNPTYTSVGLTVVTYYYEMTFYLEQMIIFLN